jgi:dihydrodipicolinate synthase/N-acetylneuraminate lyase
VSGIGERPAVVHGRTFGLSGFTTGSGCLAPRLSNALLAAMAEGDWARAETLRAEFLPLEDLRDAWGPARVLHHATELAGIARTGPIPPYVSALGAGELERLAPVARALREGDA